MSADRLSRPDIYLRPDLYLRQTARPPKKQPAAVSPQIVRYRINSELDTYTSCGTRFLPNIANSPLKCLDLNQKRGATKLPLPFGKHSPGAA